MKATYTFSRFAIKTISAKKYKRPIGCGSRRFNPCGLRFEICLVDPVPRERPVRSASFYRPIFFPNEPSPQKNRHHNQPLAPSPGGYRILIGHFGTRSVKLQQPRRKIVLNRIQQPAHCGYLKMGMTIHKARQDYCVAKIVVLGIGISFNDLDAFAHCYDLLAVYHDRTASYRIGRDRKNIIGGQDSHKLLFTPLHLGAELEVEEHEQTLIPSIA